MATLKHRKKYGELEIKCDCKRVHTITQEKNGDDVVFAMETDESEIVSPIPKTKEELEKEKENANKNNNSGGSDQANKHAQKKGLLDFEL